MSFLNLQKTGNNDGQNAGAEDNSKNLISLDDVDFTSKSQMINSPRSIEACKRMGVQPQELYQLSEEEYKNKYPEVIGLSQKLFQYRYDAEEKFRKETIEQVKQERKK